MKFIKDNSLSIISTYLNVIIGTYIVKKSFELDELSVEYTIIALIISTLILKLFEGIKKRYDKSKQILICFFLVIGIVIFSMLFNMINNSYKWTIFYFMFITIAYFLLTYKLIKIEGGEILININILYITLLIMENLNINFIFILIILFNLFFTIFVSNYEGIKKRHLIKDNVNIKMTRVVCRAVAFIIIIVSLLNVVPVGNNSILFDMHLRSKERDSEREDEVTIQGPITLSSNEIYRVVGLPFPNTKYYFKKKVLDLYIGDGWKKSDNEFNDFNLKLINSNYLDKDKIEVSIEPVSNYSDKYLSLDYTVGMYSKSKVLYNKETNEFKSEEQVKNSYTIQYINSQTYNNNLLKNNKILDNKDSENKYVQVPDNISEKVKKLVSDITKGCKSDYEKVEKIKEYLSKGYKYTLTPAERGEDEEFLEYFLFKEKKGYCVYYATAMTVMCRIAGVPARYVEGYSIKNEYNSEEMIKESDGHAWVEVLYNVSTNKNNEKIWYIYDPTPPTEREEVADNLNNGETSESTNNDLLKNTENMDNSSTTNTEVKKKKNKWAIVGTEFIIVLIGLIIIKLVYLYIKKLKVIKGKNVALYLYVLRRLKKINIYKYSNESDTEFLDRIDDEELKAYLSKIVKAVHKEYFGDYKDVNIEKKKECDYIENYLRHKQGTIMYWIKLLV